MWHISRQLSERETAYRMSIRPYGAVCVNELMK